MDRQVNVSVNIAAAGNLAAVTAQANAQVALLSNSTKTAAASAAQLAANLKAAGNAAGTGTGGRGGGGGARRRGGGGFFEALESAASATRPAGVLGAATMATVYGSINSVSDVAGSQITNSFRQIANEIGIATIPAAVRFTGTLQNLAHGLRSINESTGGVAGNLVFTGGLLLTGVGALGMAGNAVASTVRGLRGLGILAGGPAAGALAGNVVARAAGGGAGSAAAGAGGGAATTGTAALGGWAVPIAALVALIGDTIYTSHAAARAEEAGFRPRPQEEQLYGIYRGLNRIPVVSTGVQMAQSIINAQHPERAFPTHGLGAWLAETIGLGAPGPGQGPEDVTERQPRMYGSPDEMYQAMLMRVAGTPGALAEQESRALEALATALNTNTAALMANTSAGSNSATWGSAPAGENG